MQLRLKGAKVEDAIWFCQVISSAPGPIESRRTSVDVDVRWARMVG